MDRPKTAVIIGAGPAGLTAAYYLLKQTGIKPVVLEKLSVIGGISRTVDYRGNRMDLGGHRFFSKNREIVDFWLKLVPPAPDLNDSEGRMLTRNRVSRIFFNRRLLDYPLTLSVRTFGAFGLGNTALVGWDYLKCRVCRRPEKSLEDFYINRFGVRLYRMFFESYTEKLWGIHPRDIAPDWGAQRVKGVSLSRLGWQMLKKCIWRDAKTEETSLIDSFWYPRLGPGQMWDAIADEIARMGGEICLNCNVSGLDLADGGIRRVCYDQNGVARILDADYVFSSMPISELIAAMGAAVPPAVAGIAGRLPYRDFITVGLLVKKLKISGHDGGLIPDCWIYIQSQEVKLGRLQIFNNWSPFLVRDSDTVWLGLEYFCTRGDALWELGESELIAMAAGELVKLGIINSNDVLDGVRVAVEKAYPGYFGSYAGFGQIRQFLSSCDNLYCIGRNGQHRYNNMDHSMLTAIAAVKAVTGEAPAADIWQVNAEQEYHEKSVCRS